MDITESRGRISGQPEFKFVAVEPKKRPPCPRCGAWPHHHNEKWRCTSCGKEWMKKYSPVDYSRRPRCPRCSALHAIKDGGKRWVCGECRKSWQEKSPQMPGRTQAILVLARVNPKMTHEEIAKLVGCSRRSVSNTLKNHKLSEVENG